MGATNKSSSDVLVLHLPGGSEIDSSEPENQMLEPLTASLLSYPNPFNPQTEIKFVVQKTGPVSLRVFDIRGRLVSELVGQHLQEGEHSVTWDGRNYSGRQVASGVYFARLEIGSIVLSRQLVLLK